MLFEHYHPQDLLTPTINDGGVNKLNSSLTSLDFYLLDDINAYLTPVQSKRTKNDNNSDNNQHQEELFSDFDFGENSEFLSSSISIEDLDLEKWISQSSFPSPPMDTINYNTEDTSSTFPWIGEQITDMVVPLSPPLSSASSSPSPPVSSASSSPSPPVSSASSSPAPITKKSKLSIVERRIRKKDQNKTAAEKYRIKKKSERHILLDRQIHLKNTNKELKLELENLTYRVQQFKQLFGDLIQQ